MKKKILKTFSQKLTLWCVPFFIKYTSLLLLSTCSWKVHGLSTFLKEGKKGNTVVAFWHSFLFLTPFLFVKNARFLNFTAFVSKSRDGELVSRIVESYKNASCVRVAHNKKGTALKELIHALKDKKRVALITPDGPRGPAKQAKEGVYLATKKGQSTFFGIKFSVSKYWTLSSWDKLVIPKPFSQIEVTFSPPEKGDDPSFSLEKINSLL